jgi:serine/threonine-protein kinase
MEGSVQRAGERVRINVQLIDAGTDEHLWAEIYDRELTTDNLFDIQSEIAKSIAVALKATLTDSELASVADVPTDNVEAYDLFLQARRFTHLETMNAYQTAIELFKESLAKDPDFKLAWISLARAHMTNYWVYGGDVSNRELAREAINKARAIDSSFAELYMAEGFYWYWGHLDYERALYNLQKAIEMMPGNDEAYMWQGWVSRRAGLWEQAPRSMQKALKLNPRVHFNWHEYSLTLMYLHRYDEARKAVLQARELDPDSFWGKTSQARLLLQDKGDVNTALQLTVGAQHSNDYGFFNSFMLVRLYARQYDEILAAARNISDQLEIQRDVIELREDLSAQILHHMGRYEEAKQAANAALFRLKGLRTTMGDDYRLDLAEARISAILGAAPAKIDTLVQKSKELSPNDDLAEFELKYFYARVFGLAGMVVQAVEMLNPVLRPPSGTSVLIIDLDPAFDSIRDAPEFTSMMKQHR